MNHDLNAMDAGEILRRALSGEKLFPDEAIFLGAEAPLLDLALAAGEVCRRIRPDGAVGYAVSRTIIYSNVCQPRCPFCAATVTQDDPAAFTRTAAEVASEAAAAASAGATQIILQGGHRIDLPWAYYTDLVRAIRERCPGVQLLAYSPSEIMVWGAAFQKRSSEVIADLQGAGMDGLLAGGDESLAVRAPEYRALLRGPWNEWFDIVHRCADAGLPVVAPFVFGLGESAQERIGHLFRIRAVQERTAAAHGGQGVFRALAVFTLDPGAPIAGDRPAPPVTGYEYLRMVALGRILLPAIPHIQSSFLAQGAKVAQAALDGGADDLGPTHLEFDRAELAAGRIGPMTPAEMERLIRDAGRIPARRNGW